MHPADDGGRARLSRHPRPGYVRCGRGQPTKRELEILQLICRSKSREEIAELLGISKRTVGFHITNMLEKTGHKSVVGLAVEAAEKGLTSAETQNECERDDTVFS
ncbi:helix-turn-helix transcriptional regulator [Mitsuokella jalaludinii]|uniref:response regulator transcription factor n=1 Tax=Mitsuokella jalaludinii TaxID=187979 RepID=UPI003078CB04